MRLDDLAARLDPEAVLRRMPEDELFAALDRVLRRVVERCPAKVRRRWGAVADAWAAAGHPGTLPRARDLIEGELGELLDRESGAMIATRGMWRDYRAVRREMRRAARLEGLPLPADFIGD